MKQILLIAVVLIGLLTGCTSGKNTLEETIVGKWEDDQGYTIEFYDGGTGFIEGVGDAIPDTTFFYSIVDDSTIEISFQGGTFEIGVDIENDRLTWEDELGEVVYSRVE